MFRLISIALFLCVCALLYLALYGVFPETEQGDELSATATQQVVNQNSEPLENTRDREGDLTAGDSVAEDIAVKTGLPDHVAEEKESLLIAAEVSAEEKEKLAQSQYARLRRLTLRTFKDDYAKSVYASIRVPGWFGEQLSEPGMGMLPAIRPEKMIDGGLADSGPDNASLLPSRGFSPLISTAEKRSGSSLLLSYASASAASLSPATRRAKSSEPSCGPLARKAWRGAARISNRDYIEPFVVCEAESIFSIVVDWRTSDVCQLDEPFVLPNQIRAVEVVELNANRSDVHRRVGSKDRLSIQLAGGERMLLTCEGTHWAVVEAGVQPWSSG